MLEISDQYQVPVPTPKPSLRKLRLTIHKIKK